MGNRFDEQALSMDAHPIINEIARAFADEVIAHVGLSTDLAVLDLGCGSGLIGMHLHGLVGRLTMVDSSKNMLAILREKIRQRDIGNIDVIEASVTDVGELEGRYDVIYLNNVLHHVEDIAGLFEAAKSVLKTGGHLCIGDLVTEDGTFHDEGMGVHHLGFDGEALKTTLAERGFTKIRLKEYYIVRKPDRTGTLREYPLFFLAAERV